jgi:hypothetical protein
VSGELWIVIPNWEKFQHYSDRDPPWIKLYPKLNSKSEWCELSTAARGMLTTIWCEFARSSGHLPLSKAMQLCGKSARSKHVEALVQAGFIQLSASRPLALARSRESTSYLREEKSAGAPAREEPRAAPAPEERKAPAAGETVCPRCGIDRKTPDKLRDHLANVHDEFAAVGLVPDEFAEHVRAMSRMRVGE